MRSLKPRSISTGRVRLAALVIGLLACSSLPTTVARADTRLESVSGYAARALVAGVHVTPRGRNLVVKVGDQEEIILQPDGGTRSVFTSAPVRTDPEDDVGQCIAKKSTADDPDRFAYAPVPVAAAANVGHIQYIFNLYRLEGARRVAGALTRQYETCSRGLGQSDAEHWRMTLAGAAQADTNLERTTRIGWRYESGATPPSYNLTYGFATGTKVCGTVPAANACADSSVTGSLTQTRSGQLKGGFRAPMGNARHYWENGVAGWWDGYDVGGALAYQSQGTVVHSLWEYPEDDPIGLEPGTYFEVYASFACSRWFGFGCDVPESRTTDPPH